MKKLNYKTMFLFLLTFGVVLYIGFTNNKPSSPNYNFIEIFFLSIYTSIIIFFGIKHGIQKQ